MAAGNADQSPENHPTDPEEFLNWNLLKRVYAVMHLAEIYLPLQSDTMSWEDSARRGFDGRGSLLAEDPLDVPGYVTADTVQYLRLHELLSAEQSLNDTTDNVASMINSRYPEQDALYWPFLIALVTRGCLEQAWGVLTQHSLYRGTSNEQLSDSAVDREIRDGFHMLKQLLLTAPLPGGRVAEYDDRPDTQVEDVDGYQVDGFGVVPSDYLLWSSVDRTSSGHPMGFSPHAALQKFREWHEFAERVRRTCSLSHKFPSIKLILAILCGDLNGVTFTYWAEHLCAELLYCTPDRRPRTMCARVQKLTRDYRQEDQNVAAIHIMNGDAGHAIIALYKWGGGTGAALVSTLVSKTILCAYRMDDFVDVECSLCLCVFAWLQMSLLFSLYVDSGIIPQESREKKIDFITDAAWDILSSLQGSEHADIGVQLAIRLLLPYSLPASETEAVISNILQHYSPTTDQYANTTISLVRKALMEGKHSVQVLDGCTSILLSLYRKYMKQGIAGVAVMIILDGIELEDSVLPKFKLGVCFRTLTMECHRISQYLLHIMADKSETATLYRSTYDIAKSMVDSFRESRRDSLLLRIPAVAELTSVVAIIDSGTDPSQCRVKGDHIVALLSRDNDGVHDSTPATTRLPCLSVAERLIAESKVGLASIAESSPFSVQGMSLLMQRQLMLPDECQSKEATVELQHGLLRAIVGENAKRRSASESSRWDSKRKESTMDSVQYANFSELDASTQRQFVQNKMLNWD
jgi:Nup85 Nucleoporin